ncbi:C45 family autoproteolytic acyltransferase/hydolase [Mesorhizobium retamae]|uniref:C45 family peptidase n=1 Tax=Mesorhizobium retamae TaxID=2912854 RepID=A0ABS9QMS3_9HYPH|nr:C45 family peptidase [Mesorhizobium sp. IRAMC:0171]MCG7508756.1 C45 family peptidase [Mesorhizobium sp. IRAMC:0171]
MTVSQFPLIEIHGTPRERGRQYGQAAAERIKRGVSHYLKQFADCGLDGRGIRSHVESYLPRIHAYDGDLVEEMKGIAEGAGIDFDSVVLLNARTELLHEALEVQKRASEREQNSPDGCTGVVVLPSASADGTIIHATNWDWKAECAETAVVLQIRRDDGPDVLMFAEAGAVSRAGVNAAGIAITANYIESDRDFEKPGIPLALLRRKALEAETYAGAIGVIVSTQKLTSNNLILSHRDGVAIDFECAPSETFAVYPDNGLIVHANHWTSTAALSKYKDVGILGTPDSLYRDLRVKEHLKPKIGNITRRDVITALRDEFGAPLAVCRAPLRKSERGDLTATVATLMIDSNAGTMDITPLPALNRQSTTYTLSAARNLAA